MRNSSLNAKGFTLIELIISVGLFSVVAVIAASAYLNLVSIDRTTRATNDLVNNMTFVMNSIASNLRTGSKYICNTPDGNGNGECSAITFTDASGCVTTYTYTGESISVSQAGAATCTDSGVLTDPKIDITDARFILMGNPSSDVYEPQVIIFISGSLDSGPGKKSTFSVQTSATQRGIDIP